MKVPLLCSCLLVAGTAAARGDPSSVSDDTSPSPASHAGPPFRFGVQLGGGGFFFPEGALAGGLALRPGVQLGRLGLVAEIGQLGGFLRDIEDPAASRVSALGMSHVTLMAELDLTERAFVAGGVVLGLGIMLQTKHGITRAGAVRSQSMNMAGEGLVNFASGANVRGGWRFGDGPHRLVVGVDLKLLGADGHVATTTISSTREILDARDVRQAIWTLVPMVFIGWEFKQ
ncbi:hypothetical protein JQX13_34020 [Archangium violaceum]|uniref:hypothetical protein n=1 Tax=Archangium violaceum TaxID=83451 RepID=UPI00193C4E38|nr:hypothetical protein [Archangium violaceum]QRK05190.1 hypothetical protein JQX13_34020 [Archangium violaceum]